MVFVEVNVIQSQWLQEVQWVQDISRDSIIGGIVSQAPPNFSVPGSDLTVLTRDVSSLAALPLARGIRVGAMDWTNASLVSLLLPHFSLLADRHLSADVVLPVTRASAAGIASVASAFPKMNFIVDHLGGPPVLGSATELADWEEGLVSLAKLENVFIKVGGILQSYKSSAVIPNVTVVEPFVKIGLTLFSGRALFERNWFFCKCVIF